MDVQVFLLTQVEMNRPSSVIASTVPECLLPVANREILDIQLEALEKCGKTRKTWTARGEKWFHRLSFCKVSRAWRWFVPAWWWKLCDLGRPMFASERFSFLFTPFLSLWTLRKCCSAWRSLSATISWSLLVVFSLTDRFVTETGSCSVLRWFWQGLVPSACWTSCAWAHFHCCGSRDVGSEHSSCAALQVHVWHEISGKFCRIQQREQIDLHSKQFQHCVISVVGKSGSSLAWLSVSCFTWTKTKFRLWKKRFCANFPTRRLAPSSSTLKCTSFPSTVLLWQKRNEDLSLRFGCIWFRFWFAVRFVPRFVFFFFVR